METTRDRSYRLFAVAVVLCSLFWVRPVAAEDGQWGGVSLDYVDNDFVVLEIYGRYGAFGTLYREGEEVGSVEAWGGHKKVTVSGLTKGNVESFVFRIYRTENVEGGGTETVFKEALTTVVTLGRIWGTIRSDVTYPRQAEPGKIVWTADVPEDDDVFAVAGTGTNPLTLEPGVELSITEGVTVRGGAISFTGASVSIDKATLDDMSFSETTTTGSASLSVKDTAFGGQVRFYVTGACKPQFTGLTQSSTPPETSRSAIQVTGIRAADGFTGVSGCQLPWTDLDFSLHGDGAGVTVADNSLYSVYVHGHWVDSTPELITGSVTITGNTLTGRSNVTGLNDSAIRIAYLGPSGEIQVRNNTPPQGADTLYSMRLENVAQRDSEGTFRSVTDNSGIDIIRMEGSTGCSSMSVQQNTIVPTAGYGYGMLLHGNNNVIAANTLRHQGYSQNSGILVGLTTTGYQGPASGNTIRGNVIEDFNIGLELQWAQGNTIFENKFNSNNYSIGMRGTDGTAVGDVRPEGNTIYNNSFRNCGNAHYGALGVFATDPRHNAWSTDKQDGESIVGGSQIGGNFWDDYSSPDNDGDGFVDQTRVLDYENVDSLPLAGPVLSVSGSGRDFMNPPRTAAVDKEILALELRASATWDWSVNSITVQASGSGNDQTDVEQVTLGGQTGAFSADNGTLTFTFSPAVVVPAGNFRTFFLVYRFAKVEESCTSVKGFVAEVSAANVAATPETLAPGQKDGTGRGELTLACVRNTDMDEYYENIQAAVDDAQSDDHIEVCRGTFHENVVIGKRLTIKSIEGPEVTTVQAVDSQDHVFFLAECGITIQGFTITGAAGSASDGKVTAGVFYDASQAAEKDPGVAVLECKVTGNECGISLSAGKLIANCTVVDNSADGVILKDKGPYIVHDNRIAGNGGSGIAAVNTEEADIRWNYIGTDEYGAIARPNATGIMLDNSTSISIYSNLVSGNTAAGIQIKGGDSNAVYGNRIGTNSAVSAALPNAVGVILSNGTLANMIGVLPEVDAERNVIGGNSAEGVLISGAETTQNKIMSNYFGTDKTGVQNLANGSYGIRLTADAVRNKIANNYFRNGYVIATNAYGNDENYWNTAKFRSKNIVGGPYVGGNYWSDYEGCDEDADSLGDQPYAVPGGAQDVLPLLLPALSIAPGSYNPADTSIEGGTEVTVLHAKLVNATDADKTVTSLMVHFKGDGDKAKVTQVHVYEDASCTGSKGTQLGQGALAGDAVTFSGLTLAVPAGESRCVLVTYELAVDIPPCAQYGAQILAHSDIAVADGSTVGGSCLPVSGSVREFVYTIRVSGNKQKWYRTKTLTEPLVMAPYPGIPREYRQQFHVHLLLDGVPEGATGQHLDGGKTDKYVDLDEDSVSFREFFTLGSKCGNYRIKARIEPKETYPYSCGSLPPSAEAEFTVTAATVKEIEQDMRREDGQLQRIAELVDPVNVTTGNFGYSHTDLTAPTAGVDLEITRYYDSLDIKRGWKFSIISTMDTTDTDNVVVHWGDGAHQAFSKCEAGWEATYGPDTMTRVGDTYVVHRPERPSSFFDLDGRLRRVVDRKGNGLLYEYDGRNITITDTTGYTLATVGRDDSNRVVTITDAAGNAIAYTYDGARLLTYTNRLDQTTTYEYDAAGILARVRGPDGTALVDNTYDSAGRVLTQDDARAHRAEFAYTVDSATYEIAQTTATYPDGTTRTYDNFMNLVASTEVNGTTVRYAYGAGRKVTGMTDARGGEWTVDRTARGLMTAFTDPAGNRREYAYDDHDNVTRIKDPLGREFVLEYDANNNLVAVTDPAGARRTAEYNAQNLRITTTDELGNITQYAYNDRGLPASVTHPNGGVESYTYDALGNIVLYEDPLGNKTEYQYDNGGRLTKVTDPLSRTTQYEYDAYGDLVSETDAKGRKRTAQYTADGLLTSATLPDGRMYTHTYDARGRLTKTEDADGNAVQRAYDATGRLSSITYPVGQTAEFGYDAAGNLTGVTDGNGNVRTTEYDALNRPQGTTNADGGTVTSLEMNAVGLVTQTTDQLGRTVTLEYDAMNNLTRVALPGGIEATAEYDALGRVLKSVDPNGNETHFEYNASGRTVKRRNALDKEWKYAYDKAGRMATAVDPNQVTTTYTFDAAGRPVQITAAGGETSFTKTYAYDATDNPVAVDDDAHTQAIEYTYDVGDRLVKRKDVFSNVVEYEHDKRGNVVKITYPDGNTLAYSYDADNRMTRIEDWLGHTTTYEYDNAGNLVKTTYPNGCQALVTYDAAGRITAVRNLDAEGTVVTANALVRNAGGHLTRVTAESAVEPDMTGLADAEFTVNELNQVVSSARAEPIYDDNGNMLSCTVNGKLIALQYDLLNRLTGCTISDNDALTYDYDAEDNRVAVTENGTTRRYVVDTEFGALANPLAVTDADNNITTYCVWDANGLSYTMDVDGALHVFLFNYRGDTTAVVDDDGTVVAAYAYSPYGKVIGATGMIDTPFKYMGRYGVVSDNGTLYCVRARYYLPDMGRYTQPDILSGGVASPITLNRYIHASSDPVEFVDVDGHVAILLIDPNAVFGQGHAAIAIQNRASGKFTIYSLGARAGTLNSVRGLLGVSVAGEAYVEGRQYGSMNSRTRLNPGIPARYKDVLLIETTEEQEEAMRRIADIDAGGFNEGDLDYNFYTFNCGDFAQNVLEDGLGMSLQDDWFLARPNALIAEFGEHLKQAGIKFQVKHRK